MRVLRAKSVTPTGQVKACKLRRMAGLAALMALGLAASGCAMRANAIDDALTTSAISMAEPTPSIATDPFAPTRDTDAGGTDRLIDEDTIRLAVTTADINQLPDGRLAWASAATGSSGAISDIAEIVVAGQTCRSFKAIRRAYDGVSLYDGEVCHDPRAGWWTRSLAPQSGQ